MNMRIMGIDPGLASTGVAIIDGAKDLELLHSSVIRTEASQATPARLAIISDRLEEIEAQYKPRILAVETAFVRRDTPGSALSLGKVLGVILLMAHKRRLDIAEITPREIKETLTGNGNAGKMQIERAVSKWLRLKETLKPSHAADAAAVALTAAALTRAVNKTTLYKR